MTSAKAQYPDDARYNLLLKRSILRMQVTQSPRVVPFIALYCVTLTITLWQEVPRPTLVTWLLLLFLSTAARSVLSHKIRPQLDTAPPEQLERFQRWIFISGIVNSTVVGSSFWWVGLDGSEHAVFLITIGCCIYATGAMANASVHFPSFRVVIPLILGHGVIFFAGIGGPWEPTLVIALLCIITLMLGFGSENARQFAESLRIREENTSLLTQLNAEKKSVEAALVTVRNANEQKGRFLAAASHDLRQPMYALRLLLGHLSHKMADSTLKVLIDRISQSADVLCTQFNNLLDLSQLDMGKSTFEPMCFSINDVVVRIAEESRLNANEKGLDFRVETDSSVVYSDPLKVEQVIRNLVENAIRYTERGQVTLRAKITDANVEISVSDTGAGLSDLDKTRIFKDFVQLDSVDRRQRQGIGLGLAIVQRINRLLRLNLKVESTLGMGSVFTFFVPLPYDETIPSLVNKAMTRPEPDISGLRVWVIEDDPDVREALLCQLQAWHCEPHGASSRKDVETLVQRIGQWPHFLLADDILGNGETGLDLAQWVLSYLPPERIIFITGNTDPERHKEIRQYGFHLATKPMLPDKLKHLLSALSRSL